MAPRLVFFAFLLSLITRHCYALLGQVCQFDDVRDIDICIVFSSLSLDASSYHLAFSGKFSRGLGWAAFGRGVAMDGALMFLFYPNNALDGLTVSVRSTTGHYPPALFGSHAQLSLLHTSVTSEGYYTAEIICHACRLGDEHLADESWIWSVNTNQRLQTDDVQAELQMHIAYDYFSTMVQSDDVLHGDLLSVSGNRSSTIKQIAGDRGKHATGALVTSHGVIMLCSFLILYPVGILAMARGSKHSFPVHAGIQLFATVCVLLGIILGLSKSRFFKDTVYMAVLSHGIVGLAVFTLLVLQITLGLRHHSIFMKTRAPTIFSNYHKRIGFMVTAGGFLNTIFGLYISNNRDFSATPLTIVVALCVIWALLLLLVKNWKSGQRVIEKQDRGNSNNAELEGFLQDQNLLQD
ncbi:CBD9-like protein [Biscogniauxia marginata]|nr:CBD9-like protein [Biscogniauxia marginata]